MQPLKFIKGTEGKPNYLVLFNKNDVTVALRPIIKTTEKGLFVGGNVRIVWEDKNQTSEETKKRLRILFPGLTGLSINESRASRLVGMVFPLEEHNPKLAIPKSLECVSSKESMTALAQAVLGCFGNSTNLENALSVKQLSDFLSGAYTDVLEAAWVLLPDSKATELNKKIEAILKNTGGGSKAA